MLEIKSLTKLSLVTAMMFQLGGCGGSGGVSDNGGGGGGGGSGSGASKLVTLDATDGSKAAYLDLEYGATDGDIEAQWHLSYQKYLGFKSNSGVSGSGDIRVCVAKEYSELYDEAGKPVPAKFKEMTGASTLSGFNEVTKSSCVDDEYIADTITTQIKMGDWLDADYSQGAPVYSVKEGESNGWIIRSASKGNASGEYAYAHIKVKDVTVALGGTPSRKIVYSFEEWDSNTQTLLAAVDSPEIDFTSGRVYWDLETNKIVDKTDDWELSIATVGRSYAIQLNGGASGTGSAGVGALQVPIGEVTDPTNTNQVYKYFADTASGALSTPGDFGPFAYSVDGNHGMWPTFSVYLFKTPASESIESRYFKAQILSNSGADGTLASGDITVRYEEVY